MAADGGLLSEFKNATQEQDEVTQGPVKNFPPFCCKPAQCANVNISGIPDSHLKGLMRRSYVFFYISWICPLVNAAAMAAKLSIEPKLPHGTLDLILSLGYILPYIFGHLGVWILWYSLAASSGKKRLVFSYIFGFLLLAFEIIMCLGVPQTGAGGFGTIVTMYPAHHIVAGSLGVASFVLWDVMIGFHIYLIVGWIRWKKGHVKPKAESHHEDDESHHEDTLYQPPEIPTGPAKVEKSSSNPFETPAEMKSSGNPFDSTPSSTPGGNPFD